MANSLGSIAPRRDGGLMQRAPEAIAGMSVVVPEAGGARARGGADEDKAQVGAELVGQAVRCHLLAGMLSSLYGYDPNGARHFLLVKAVCAMTCQKVETERSPSI